MFWKKNPGKQRNRLQKYVKKYIVSKLIHLFKRQSFWVSFIFFSLIPWLLSFSYCSAMKKNGYRWWAPFINNRNSFRKISISTLMSMYEIASALVQDLLHAFLQMKPSTTDLALGKVNFEKNILLCKTLLKELQLKLMNSRATV